MSENGRNKTFSQLFFSILVEALKGFIAEIHKGAVLKQLNYPISMLPIRFRSIDHRRCKSLIFTDSTNCWLKNRLTKKRRIINKKFI